MMFIKTAVTMLSLGVYATGELCVDSNLKFKIESGEETTCSNLVEDGTLDCTQSATLNHCKDSCDVKFCCADSQAAFKVGNQYVTCRWNKILKNCDDIPNLVDTCPVTCGKCNPTSALLGMISEQGKKIKLLENELNIFVHGDYVYKVAERMKWEEHKAAAVVWGGHLASIHTDEEHDFILRLIKRHHTMRDEGLAYIGLRDHGENDWRWTDGTKLDYSKWSGGEPNRSYETVAVMYKYDGTWADENDHYEYPGVYKKLGDA